MGRFTTLIANAMAGTGLALLLIGGIVWLLTWIKDDKEEDSCEREDQQTGA